MRQKLVDKTTLKFLAVGVVNTLVGDGIMFLFYNLVKCSYWFSTAANYVVGSIASFFLNKYFTFQNQEHSIKQVAKFIANVIVCYFVAYGTARSTVIWLLSRQPVKVQENVAMFVGMSLYTVFNYFVQRFFIFQTKEK